MSRTIVALIHSAQYLDMKTPEDILLNLLLSIVGFIGFLYLISKNILSCNPLFRLLLRIMVSCHLSAQFSHLLTTFHITIKRHLRVLQQLREYMRYKELPTELQHRLLTFYRYRNKKQVERNLQIINEVSPYLKQVR